MIIHTIYLLRVNYDNQIRQTNECEARCNARSNGDGPQIFRIAKKILREEYAGGVKFYSRVMGPLNQVMWSWEVESMDEEMARNAKLQMSEEWNQMVAEFMPHVESSSIGDALWMQVSQTD